MYDGETNINMKLFACSTPHLLLWMDSDADVKKVLLGKERFWNAVVDAA